MSAPSRRSNPRQLNARLCDAPAATADLVSQVISQTCHRFPIMRHSEKTAQIERLIQSEAWTDAALALVDLELPRWKIRRIVYDEGEWHCALSRQRELPEWLDQSIETRHADLPLAILTAFVDAQCIAAPASRTSVPAVSCNASPLYESACCDNFA